MFGPFRGEARPGLLIGTIKAGIVIAALSVLATNWLAAGGFDQGALSRLAADAARGYQEPSATGSIRALDGARLDPCAGPRKP